MARMGASNVFGVDNSVDMIIKAQSEWEELRGCSHVEATFGMVDCIKASMKDLLGEKCGHFDYAIGHYVTGRCQNKDGQHF